MSFLDGIIQHLYQKTGKQANQLVEAAATELMHELTKESTIRNFRSVQKEGNREVNRDLSLYSLDVVISVGYRVKSIRGTQFRIWATERLNRLRFTGLITFLALYLFSSLTDFHLVIAWAL